MSRGSGKVICTCNNCGHKQSTTISQHTPCKCGSYDMVVDDQWELTLKKYAEERKEHWTSKGVR